MRTEGKGRRTEEKQPRRLLVLGPVVADGSLQIRVYGLQVQPRNRNERLGRLLGRRGAGGSLGRGHGGRRGVGAAEGGGIDLHAEGAMRGWV